MNKEKNRSFSAIDRTKHLQRLKSETFDILVIGGGATGCGIALDAASRGMKTALIEKADFASGTSSKSTKLIHGGLRYLKQFEVGLVRETGRERAIVHKLAPHLVHPEKMLLPIIKNGTFGKWAASLGVMVYDVLAGVKKIDRRKMLSKEEALEIEPLLDAPKLLGACYYAEYRTDDARLTIELIKRASTFGATAVNYCKATGFIYGDKNKPSGPNAKITAVTCKDELTGEIIEIKAKEVVSAGGPWVDKLRKVNQSINNKQLHLTKGVHIVFPHEKLPLKQSIYFDVPDGRMIFAIPRGKTTYVGTTDTNYKGDLNRVVATREDLNYLIAAIQGAFPTVQLKMSDAESNWAGLRPLIHEDGKSPSELSRKDEIFESPSGLISIAGGKLTGYRKMAERVIDLVAKRLAGDFRNCQTMEIPLLENSFKNTKAVNAYMIALKERVLKAGLSDYHCWYLVTTYGKQAETILNQMNQFSDKAEVAFARAEVLFGVECEMINSLSDYFVRRTGRLYFDVKSIDAIRAVVTDDLSNYLKWDNARKALENKIIDDLIYDVKHYYEEEFAAV